MQFVLVQLFAFMKESANKKENIAWEYIRSSFVIMFVNVVMYL